MTEETIKPNTTSGPLRFNVEELTYAENLVRFASFEPWLEGIEPFMVEDRIEHSVAAKDLLPNEFRVERAVTTIDSFTVVARGKDCSICLDVGLRFTELRVTATSQGLAESVADSLRKAANVDTGSTKVPARVWNCSGHGTYDDRQLDATCWVNIENNYPEKVRSHLGQLMQMERPELDSPRLIIWHGKPGTGKTTALRSLAMQWQDWASVQYVSDPSVLFQDPKYLDSVLDTSPREPKGPTFDSASKADETWQLIVAEDVDEFLKPTSSTSASTALGKVLNLSDGIFGQHHRALIVLTTNDEVGRLHPALIRPGRCLAEIEFSEFSTGEANTWLEGNGLRTTRPMTLAELLVKRGDIKPGSKQSSTNPSIGAYL